MKRQTLLALGALVIGLVAVTSAQTVNLDIHRGFVQIRSTASAALVVLGGAVLGNATDPSGALLDVRATADGTGVGGGMRISRVANDSYLIINADDDGAAGVGFIQAGDSSAYRPLKLNPLGSQVLIGDGTAALPSMAFVNDSDVGFYYESIPPGIGVSILGAKNFVLGSQVLTLNEWAGGTGGGTGRYIDIGRNTSGTGSPGGVFFRDKNGAAWVVWADSTGVIRTGGTFPSAGSGDTIGTVLGTQTSSRSSKDILRRVTETALAMQTIRDTPVYEFRYKSGAYNGEVFTGIVTDESPMFGMDQGKSFNPVSAFGASVLALQDLDARVRELEARLRSLEARR